MSLTAGVPQPSLAWQFESSSVDSVTGLAPSSVSGTVTYNLAGKYGASINVFSPTNSFSNAVLYGSSSVALTPSISSINGFTMCFWLRPHLFYSSGNSTFFGFAGINSTYSSYFNILGASSGQVVLYCQNPQSLGTAFQTGQSPALPSGSWSHLAIVCSPGASYSVITCYLNASSFGSLTTNTVALGSFSVSTIALNRNPLATYSPGSAEYDDLRIFNKALTAAQVQAVYNAQGRPNQCVFSNVTGSSQVKLWHS